MTILQVAGFNLSAKQFIESAELDSLYQDPDIRPWAASAYSALACSYLKELDDFLTDFSSNSHEAIQDKNHLKALLQAYARIITGVKYPLNGSLLVDLLNEPSSSREIFVKNLWKLHFGFQVNEGKWKRALEILNSDHPVQAFIQFFGIEVNYLNPDCQILELMARILASEDKFAQTFNLNELLEVTQKGLDILPLFLGKVILALVNKDQGLVRDAIKEAHSHQIKLTFKKEIPRNGVEIENAQGKVLNYYFEINRERQSQKIENDSQAYKEVITRFLQAQGLSPQQIRFVASTFHQSAWHGILQEPLVRQYLGRGLISSPQHLSSLRIKKNQKGLAVAVSAHIGENLIFPDQSTKPIEAGILSVTAEFPDHKYEEKEEQSEFILPGRSKPQHQEITIRYRALAPEGAIAFPGGFSQELILADTDSLQKQKQAGLEEMKKLQPRLNAAKEELARVNAGLEKIQLAGPGGMVSTALRARVQEARSQVQKVRQAGRVKTWALTLLTAVLVATSVGILFAAGAITGMLAFGLSLGLGLLVSCSLTYFICQRQGRAKTRSLVATETQRLDQQERDFKQRQLGLEQDVLDLEKKHARLKQELKILENTRLAKLFNAQTLGSTDKNPLEEKPSPTFTQQFPPFNDESTYLVSLSKRGRLLEFSVQALRSLVVYMKEKLEGGVVDPRIKDLDGHALGELLADMLSEGRGFSALLRFYNTNQLSRNTVINLVNVYGSEEQLKRLKGVRVYFGTNSFLAKPAVAAKDNKSQVTELELNPVPRLRSRSWAG